jgi:transposase
VNAGLSEVPRVPGANEKQPRPGCCWNASSTAKPTCCRSSLTPAIPATNNQAERDARSAKTQQKISGRLRSEHTTRHRYAVRGYASTATKHGYAVFNAIRDALAGNPWIPPVPAGT